MGIIAIVKPGSSSTVIFLRMTVSSDEIITAGKIEFKFLNLSASKDASFEFEKLKVISAPDNTKLLCTLWQSAWILKPGQPQWNGYMQSVHDGS